MKRIHPLAKIAALTGVAALGTLLVLGAANADEPKHKPRSERMFSKLDADQDGKLSANEVADSRIAKKFAVLDADGDGYLTKAEMKKGRMGKGRMGKGRMGKGRMGKGKWSKRGRGMRGGKHMISKLDANKDGKLSAAEVADTRIAKRFAALDTDADGYLTEAELKKGRRGHRGKGKRKGHGKRKGASAESPAADSTL